MSGLIAGIVAGTLKFESAGLNNPAGIFEHNNLIYVTNRDNNTVTVLGPKDATHTDSDYGTWARYFNFPAGNDPRALHVDDKRIYVACANTVTVINNTAPHKIVKTVPAGTDLRDITVYGNRIYVTGREGVIAIDTATLTVTSVTPVGGQAEGIDAADGRLYVGVTGIGVKVFPTTETVVGGTPVLRPTASCSTVSATAESDEAIVAAPAVRADTASYSTGTATAIIEVEVVVVVPAYYVTGNANSVTVNSAGISGYLGISARASSDTYSEAGVTAEIQGTAVTTNAVWQQIPEWVEGADVAVLGGGAGGSAYTTPIGPPGRGGEAGQWQPGLLSFRSLLNGLRRKDYRFEYRHTVGAGGIRGGIGGSLFAPGSVATGGGASSFEIRAVPIAGGATITFPTIIGVGGRTNVVDGASGSAGLGGAVTPEILTVGGIKPDPVGGGIGANTPFTLAGFSGKPPGGGGTGVGGAGNVGGDGAAGKIWWRFYAGQTISQQPFTGTPYNQWRTFTLPLDTVELDYALVGGGGGGSGGGAGLNNGIGGLGGVWRGGSTSTGIKVEDLYRTPADGLGAINPINVSALTFRYWIGSAGGAGSSGTAIGGPGTNGLPSQVSIQATVSGVTRTLVNPVSAPGGAASANPGTAAGAGTTGGDIGGGADRRLRVLGRNILCKGGGGGAFPQTASPGNVGGQPGGGGSAGAGGALSGYNGAPGAPGAVYLAFGALDRITKVQVFECLGTSDDSNTSFCARYLRKDIFDHTIIKGYPNALLPPPLGAANLQVSVNTGVTRALEQINGSTDPFILVGTSQGAQIMATVWANHVRGNPTLNARCKGVYLMGNPIREQGRGFPEQLAAGRIPAGHGIASGPLRLTGTTDLVWEFANPGDPVCTNLTSFTGGNVSGNAIETAYTGLLGLVSVVSVLQLGLSIVGVIDMLLGMNEFHNLYGYNETGGPVDLTNTYRPLGASGRPGWKIIVDHLNNVTGPAVTYRGMWLPDGRSDATPMDFTEIHFSSGSTVEALVEVEEIAS